MEGDLFFRYPDQNHCAYGGNKGATDEHPPQDGLEEKRKGRHDEVSRPSSFYSLDSGAAVSRPKRPIPFMLKDYPVLNVYLLLISKVSIVKLLIITKKQGWILLIVVY